MQYEKGYYIESENSNYQNYPLRNYGPLAKDLVEQIPLTEGIWVLDFGCATGKLIEELTKLGDFNLLGTDISYYAIRVGKKKGLPLVYHNVDLMTRNFDVILFLDVLEHIPNVNELRWWLYLLKGGIKMAVRIPVSAKEGGDFVFEASRKDKTHYQCHTKKWWEDLFTQYGFVTIKEFRGEGIWESSGVMARVLQKGVVC